MFWFMIENKNAAVRFLVLHLMLIFLPQGAVNQTMEVPLQLTSELLRYTEILT